MVYASDSFFESIKHRHIVLSWVNETDMEELELQRGWSSFPIILPTHLPYNKFEFLSRIVSL
jgi:hypothetical protein